MVSVTQKIVALLDSSGVDYTVKKHAATPTSEDSARERGEPLKIGAKALLLKCKKEFVLVVLPADKRLEMKALRRVLGSSKLRFATEEELKELTGLEKGAVPPFGNFLGIEMIVDAKLFDEEWMAFNAGSLTMSVKMKAADYKRVVEPRVEEFSL